MLFFPTLEFLETTTVELAAKIAPVERPTVEASLINEALVVKTTPMKSLVVEASAMKSLGVEAFPMESPRMEAFPMESFGMKSAKVLFAVVALFERHRVNLCGNRRFMKPCR